MSDHTPDEQAWTDAKLDPNPASQPPAPAPKPRRWPWIAGIVAALLLGYGVGATGDGTEPVAAQPSPVAETVVDVEDEAPDPEPEPEPEFHELTEDDLVLVVNTLGQKCYGSAGCNVEFRIEVTSMFDGELDPGLTYEVTYEVTGGDDPLINTLTVFGDSYSTKDKERIGAPSADSELKAKVLNVSSR